MAVDGNGPLEVQDLGRETLYQGFFRLLRVRVRHSLFRGGWSREIGREILQRGEAAAVLLYDPEADAVVLVEQFRAAAHLVGWHPWLLECAAGIIDPDESPEAVVRREAQEETTGTVEGELLFIGRFMPSPGGLAEVIHLYCGRVDSRGLGGVAGLEAEDEDIRVHVIPAPEAIAALDAGQINTGVTTIALHWLARHRDRLRLSWGSVMP